MGAYKYMRENRTPVKGSKQVIERLERPTNLPKARMLGYRAKQGFVIARVRVKKGGRKRPYPTGGRKPKRSGLFFTPGKSLKLIAEEKAGRKFRNLEVLNSYWSYDNGKHKWFEIIMIDAAHPAIKNDKKLSWIKNDKRRVYRGRTSAGKKSRGLRK